LECGALRRFFVTLAQPDQNPGEALECGALRRFFVMLAQY
jgi:hypothetical protein